MIDYRINLAKDLVSTAEQRTRFAKKMAIYLIVCAAALAAAAYFASINLLDAYNSNQQRRMLLSATAKIAGLGEQAFADPREAYATLQESAGQIRRLREVASTQVHFLPVMQKLFATLTDEIALESLSASADGGSLGFGMVVPLENLEGTDPVRRLQEAWVADSELMDRVQSIRPVTGETIELADGPVFYVKFECILKK